MTTNTFLTKGARPRTIGSGGSRYTTFTGAPRWAWPKEYIPFPALGTLPSEIVGGILTIPPTISDSNISFSITVTGTSSVTADWGDGSTEVIAITSGVETTISHSYSYDPLPYHNQASLSSSTDTITKIAHGYIDNDSVYLYSDTPITGVSLNRYYLVTNATADTFQITTRRSGSIVSIGTTTTAYLSAFKQVEVRVTPNGGDFGLVNFYNGDTNTTAPWVGLFCQSATMLSSSYTIGAEGATGGGLVTKISQNNANQLNYKKMFYYNERVRDISEVYTPNGRDFESFLQGARKIVDWPANISIYYATTLYRAFSYRSNTSDEALILEFPELEIPFCTTIYGMFGKGGGSNNVYIREPINITKMPLVTSAEWAFYSSGVSKVSLASSGVTSFYGAFGYCNFVNGKDITLDLSVARTFTQCFNNCKLLSSIVYMPLIAYTIEGMYSNCISITYLPTILTIASTFTNHNLASVFSGCNSLESVDTTHWTFPAYSSPDRMFSNCKGLRSINWKISAHLESEWTVGNYATFWGCSRLKAVDIMLDAYYMDSNMYQMFQYCTQLQTVQFTRVPTGDTGAYLSNYGYMFANCYSLMKVDHTMDWTGVPAYPGAKTANYYQFKNCYSLQRFRPTNLEGQVNLENCKLSTNALNEAYSALLPETPWGPYAPLTGVEVTHEQGIPLSWGATLTGTQEPSNTGNLSTQGYNNFLTGVPSTLTAEPISSISPELGSLSGVSMTLSLSSTPPGIGGLDITVGTGSIGAVKEDRYHVRVAGNYGALDSDFTILEAKGYEAITA